MSTALRVGQVFISGGMPTVTYNPREEMNLEEQVVDYLDEGHKILSVTGPTKTGKTVLTGKVIDHALNVDGGDISSFDKFLEFVGAELGVAEDSERSTSDETSTNTAHTYKGGVGSWANAQRKSGETNTTNYNTKESLATSLAANVKSQLARTRLPVVVDDFHYIDQGIQQEIVRFLKNPVFKGLRVVLISVPHRAYDVVRVENEMTGRVVKLDVGFWTSPELRDIATSGFKALNVASSDDVIDRLVQESCHSPHLMQTLCQQLCKQNGVRKKQEESQEVLEPAVGWDSFFRELAADTSKTVFDLLERGKQKRKDRKKRVLKDGSETDIYGLVLRALARIRPHSTMAYDELRDAIKEVLGSDMPQRHEITGVLEKMTIIAREDIHGEPVIEFDSKLQEIHIADPYFAYYLRWGDHVAVA